MLRVCVFTIVGMVVVLFRSTDAFTHQSTHHRDDRLHAPKRVDDLGVETVVRVHAQLGQLLVGWVIQLVDSLVGWFVFVVM